MNDRYVQAIRNVCLRRKTWRLTSLLTKLFGFVIRFTVHTYNVLLRRKLFPAIRYDSFAVLLCDYSLTSDLEFFSALLSHVMNICAKLN